MSNKKTLQTKGVINNHLDKNGNIIFWLLALLLFFPPFFRGLYFDTEFLLTHVVTAVIFLLVTYLKIKERSYRIIATPLDCALFAYVLVYLLSLLSAVHPGEAVYGFLRALNYFIIYWLVVQMVKSYKDYTIILNILLASAVGVIFIGLLAAAGTVDYPDAMYAGQISSTLQYPNTLGTYLLVMSIIAIAMSLYTEKKVAAYIYSIAAFLMLLVVMTSASKGVWIIFLLALVLLSVGLKGIYKIKSLYTMLLIFGSAFLVYTRFLAAIETQNGLMLISIIVVGSAIVLVGQAAWEALLCVQNKKGLTCSIITVMGFVLCFLGLILWKVNLSVPQAKILTILNSVKNIEQTLSFSSRADFYRWGLGIIKDHPITGVGSGGWNALYHQYQDYLCYTTLPHSHIIQVGVETGILGLIVWIAIWVLLIVIAYKIYKKFGALFNEVQVPFPRQWIIVWGTFVGALALGIHAAIDFDLHMGAISIVLWTFFALLNSSIKLENIPYRIIKTKFTVNIALGLIMGLALAIFGVSYSLAAQFAENGNNALRIIAGERNTAIQRQKLLEAESCYAKAVSFNSLNGLYQANLAQVSGNIYNSLRIEQNPRSQEYMSMTLASIDRASKNSPYDLKVINILISTCINIGDINRAVNQAEKAVIASPNDINTYNILAQALWLGTDSYRKAGADNEANKLALKLARIPEMVEKQNKRINPLKKSPPYWVGADFVLSPKAKFDIAKADYVIGEYLDCKLKLEELEISNDDNMQTWYAAALYRLGDIPKSEKIMLELKKKNESYFELYKGLIK